jgi:formate/nitrite transporter
MAYKTPAETAAAAVESGYAKGMLPTGKALVGGFLAGAYIAFGSLLAITVTSGLDPKTWGTLPTLFFGSVFALGLILVILAGAELLTGNMALLPLASLHRRLPLRRIPINWTIVLIGNFIGSIFVAYVLAIKSGVIGHAGSTGSAGLEYTRLAAIAKGKALTESDLQIFLRAIGCNWLVCLAVWLAISAEDIGGKILGIFFPIMAFVAMGFDHVVANMFFLPAAIFAHVPGITWSHTINNLVFAFLGNAVGAGVFVAGIYWYLYLRDQPSGRQVSGTGAYPVDEGATATALGQSVR